MSRRLRHQWVGSIGQLRRQNTQRRAAGSFSLHRRLRFEPLEDRRLLATITVNNPIDEMDGSIVDGDISLRDAINLASSNDTINFAASLTSGGPATIQLLNIGGGQLTINKNLTITGPGAGLLTIRAFAGTGAVGDGARIFNVDDGNLSGDKTVTISGLTLTGGDPSGGSSNGGAIFAAENLTVTSCTISGNTAVVGGGIAKVVSTGQLMVSGSTISGNTARSTGGGINANGGSLVVSQSTVSGNTALVGSASGGGILSSSTPTTIDSSTISGNSANYGGGISHGGPGILMTITNSTISGNSARRDGGGVGAFYSDVIIRHSTITANRADSDSNGTGNGGGVFVTSTQSNLTIDHTIVAGNLRQVSTRSDVFGRVTARYSLIGDNTGATIINTGGNQIGAASSPINALIGPLADNSGPTFTRALLAGSPAIDTGDPAATAGVGGVPLHDQRGVLFARVLDGDKAGVPRVDIGAFELAPSAGSFPGVPDVEDQFQALKHHGEAIGWILPEDQGAPDPSLFDHYQGIARYPGTGTPIFYVTQRGRDDDPFFGGFLETVRMGSRDTDGERLRSNLQAITGDTQGTYPPADDTWIHATPFEGSSVTIDGQTLRAYEHPGGMAIADNILFVAMDDAHGPGFGGVGMIVLFDLGRNGEWRESPIPIQALSLDHQIDNLAVVRLDDPTQNDPESFLIWVNGDGGNITRFYKTTTTGDVLFANSLRDNSLALQLVQDWDPNSPDDFDSGGTIWNTGNDAHQSSTFVQQGDGSTPPMDAPLYMIGLRHNGPFGAVGSEFADLYRVTDKPLGGYKLTHVRTLHMFAEYDGAGRIGNFAAGNNAYVSPTGELLLYSVQQDDEDGADPDYVKMEEFRHREVNRADSPLRMPIADAGGPYFVPEGHTVQLHGKGTPRADRPWVELFDDTFGWLHRFEHPDDHEGDRSIVVDYDDRGLLELNNFNSLDGFGDKTSSVLWRLPVGLNVELFDDHDFQDTKLVLTGTGQTESFGDLDDFGFGDKTSSMRFVGVDPGASALTFEWDLDADGIFGETGASAGRGDETTANPTFNAAGLISPNSFLVRLRVRDDAGVSLVSTATVHITSPVLTVNSLTDGPVNLSDSVVTLRDAIHAANNDLQVSPGGAVGSGDDEIRFQAGLAGTITLNQGKLGLTSDVTILGPGANVVTINGNNASIVFLVTDGVSGTAKTVAISGLTISGGRNAVGNGGGIFNSGSLLAENATISGNRAVTSGGAVVNYSSANTTLRNTTITQNHSDDNNSGAEPGGGIFVSAGTTILHNSIVADNFRGSDSSLEDDIGGIVSGASTHNLIGTGGSGGLTGTTNGNQVGVANPLLGPLANHGGPTLTHELLSGSPAINTGNNVQAPPSLTTDQRGGTFRRLIGKAVDIGAFEVQSPELPGDYNLDGSVDASDYVVWRKSLGQTGITPYSGADGDGNGTIDQADHNVWRAHFGNVLPPPGAGAGTAEFRVESQAFDASSGREASSAEATVAPDKTEATAARAAGFALFETRSVWQGSILPSRARVGRYPAGESGDDGLPLLLAIDRVARTTRRDSFANDDRANDEHRADDKDSESEINEPFAVTLAIRQGVRSTNILPD